MKANGKFFKYSFIFNLILGAIGFLILWPVRALSGNHILGFVICGVVFTSIAVYLNLYIVKRAKLKEKYFIFGTVVNILFCAGFTALAMLI